MIKSINFKRNNLTREEYEFLILLRDRKIIESFKIDIDGDIVVETKSEVNLEDLTENETTLFKNVFKDCSLSYKINRVKQKLNKENIRQLNNKDEEVFNKLINLNFKIDDYTSDFKVNKRTLYKKTIDYINNSNIETINEIYSRVDFEKLDNKIKRAIEKREIDYKMKLSLEVDSYIYDFKLENGNIIKVIEEDDYKSITRNVNNNDVDCLIRLDSISEKYKEHNLLILLTNSFNFFIKASTLNLYKTIFKVLYADGMIIDDMNQMKSDLLKVFSKFNNKVSARGIEGNMFRFELIMSLSYGRYVISIDDDKETYLRKKVLADEVTKRVNEYFADQNKHVLDLVLIASELGNEYKFINEHELYFIAKKFNSYFKENYWSYRPPIMFRVCEAEGQKNITKILAKHIKSFITYSGINGKWLDKKVFYDMLFEDSGIKENNFNQKIDALQEYGISIEMIDGHRYEDGKIQVSTD